MPTEAKGAYLGVNWYHNAGAALVQGDRVTAAASEERFSRQKCDMSFPGQAIRYCQEKAGGKIDGLGIPWLTAHYALSLYQFATMPVSEHIREQHQVWWPRLYQGEEVDDALVHRANWVTDQYPAAYWADYDPAKRQTYADDQEEIIATFAGIPRDKVRRFEHHLCHAYYGYFASPFRDRECLVISVDGMGDGSNAQVFRARPGQPLEILYRTDRCVLGRIYRHVTLMMGMQPLQHEYKVMGLAAYAKGPLVDRAFRVFDEVLTLDGVDIQWNQRPRDSYFHFQRELEGVRFDAIAGGMQRWVEEFLCRWVNAWVEKTGLTTVVMTGGVAMNVKAMARVGGLPAVQRFFVPGSASDDSLCIGAAMAARDYHEGGPGAVPCRVDHLYLGPEATCPEGLQHLADRYGAGGDLECLPGADDDLVAGLLSQGRIIARCVGRMEFGQRALGNRSILADPIDPAVVPRINDMIKNRDFWMPFAPVILDSFAERYLDNPKGIDSPHMTIGYPVTPEGWRALPAACHAADRTARAQIIRRRDNPRLYGLLEAFARRTGRGALLNTSFNLHGHPIVNTSEEAMEVFTASGLDGLLLPGGLLMKSSPQASLADASPDNQEQSPAQHSREFQVVTGSHFGLDERHRRSRQRWDYYTSTLKVAPTPLHVDIEATNQCNLRCLMCEGQKHMRRSRGMMDMDLYRGLIRQCQAIGVDSVRLNLWGETLLHKQAVEMVRYAKANSDLIILFNSNGVLLDEDVARGLIDAGLDKLTISVDGVTKETYEKVRCSSDFERVMHNIDTLLALRESLGASSPHVTLQIIDMVENQVEVPAFVEQWRDRVECVSVTNVTSVTGDEQVLDLSLREDKRAGRKPCEQLFQRLSVFWDGGVTVCCRDFDGALALGSVARDNLLDLWRGEALESLRQRHRDLDFAGLLCETCVGTVAYSD